MKIDQNLFADFMDSPKLAWFKINQLDTYNKIIGKYGKLNYNEKLKYEIASLFSHSLIDVSQVSSEKMVSFTSCSLSQKTASILNPVLQLDNLVCTCDLLLLDQGKYSLCCFVDDTAIRMNQIDFPLKPEIKNRILFQHYLLSSKLKDDFSWTILVIYFDKHYVKRWKIDLTEIIKVENVSLDFKDHNIKIDKILNSIKEHIALPIDQFEKIYPYNNESYIKYFGDEPEEWSVWTIPWLWNRKKILYNSGKKTILSLKKKDLKILLDGKLETVSSKYVDLYRKYKIYCDKVSIKNVLWNLKYPLFFYDYETISSGVPLLDWTSPKQQTVVQYSIHKVLKSWKIFHKEFLLPLWEADNKKLIESLYKDLWWGKKWTFIVWFKEFENSRNSEMKRMYPEYEDFFDLVNKNTFDLMDIFRDRLYFDRKFNWSLSIKKILPILTDISYDSLNINNGKKASEILFNLFSWNYSITELKPLCKDLLLYCRQDTLAMVKIWEKLNDLLLDSESILTLDQDRVKDFFLDSKNYCSLELPPYFTFSHLLRQIDKTFAKIPITEKDRNACKKYEKLNYKLLHNKDWRYSWRNFELINPVLYVWLLNTITRNRKKIQSRFKQFQKNGYVECKSIPVVSYTKESDKAEQIITRLDNIEKESLRIGLDYEYVFCTDVTDCYNSLYTHSIPRSLHWKDESKRKKISNSLFWNEIDQYIQAMSYWQTNGIPQGSVIMDFIAEMILWFSDTLLSECLKEQKIKKRDCRILRYRDDYRIFVNNPIIWEKILKELSIVLESLNMKINPMKTYHSNDIIKKSIKIDKYMSIVSPISFQGNIQNELLLIYSLTEAYPNSGLIIKRLDKLNKRISDDKAIRKYIDIPVCVSILAQIALRTPKSYPLFVSILSRIFSFNPQWISYIDSILKKFDSIPNTWYLNVWLQRLALKNKNYKISSFNDPLCVLVRNKKNRIIWQCDVFPLEYRQAIDKYPVIDSQIIEKLPAIVGFDEVSLFQINWY